MYEELLFGDEDVGETTHPKVIRVLADEPDASFEPRIRALIQLAGSQEDDDARLRKAIIDLVPDFKIEEKKPDVLPMRKRRSGDTTSI